MYPGKESDIPLAYKEERKMLFEEISKRIPCPQISLLDIGAGGGELAIPLSHYVEQYAAFEHHEDRKARLRAEGITVFSHFPAEPAPRPYDVVLISNALPKVPKEYRELLVNAWNHVKKPGGVMLIIFPYEEGDWVKLLDAGDFTYTAPELSELTRWLLASFPGGFAIQRVQTRIRTRTLDELVEALAYVYSDGHPDQRIGFATRIATQIGLSHLLTRREKDGEYEFPLDHVFIHVY